MTLTHQLLAFTGLFAMLFIEVALGYFPAFHGVAPKLMMALLYVMLLYDEEPVRLASLVTLGVIFDSLQGNPLGYTSGGLILIAIFGGFARRRLTRPPFSTLWLEFAFVMLGLFVYAIIVMASYHQTQPAVGYVLFQFSATVLLLPLVLAAHQLASNIFLFWQAQSGRRSW